MVVGHNRCSLLLVLNSIQPGDTGAKSASHRSSQGLGLGITGLDHITDAGQLEDVAVMLVQAIRQDLLLLTIRPNEQGVT